MFIWYCCITGLIGNIFVGARLVILIYKLKKIGAKKKLHQSDHFLCKSDQKFWFNRKHNLSIYSYFIGKCLEYF